MDKELTVGVMEECSLANTLMIARVDLVFIFGLMEELIMESGFKENNTVKVST